MAPMTYDKEIAASRDCGGSSSRRLEGVLSASLEKLTVRSERRNLPVKDA
jgi:hypothetical protein